MDIMKNGIECGARVNSVFYFQYPKYYNIIQLKSPSGAATFARRCSILSFRTGAIGKNGSDFKTY